MIQTIPPPSADHSPYGIMMFTPPASLVFHFPFLLLFQGFFFIHPCILYFPLPPYCCPSLALLIKKQKLQQMCTSIVSLAFDLLLKYLTDSHSMDQKAWLQLVKLRTWLQAGREESTLCHNKPACCLLGKIWQPGACIHIMEPLAQTGPVYQH